jgi:hypothetical protein
LATTTFEATLQLPCLDNKNIPVKVNKGQNLKDLVYHLVQTHAMPPYLIVSIYSILIGAMQKTCQQNVLSGETQQQKVDVKELRHLFIDNYQANTLQYHNKPEEVSFHALSIFMITIHINNNK